MPEVTKISRKMPVLPTRKKVAAYARVSEETEQLAHSLSAQISYYNGLIQKNPEWEFAGVYADRFITGTNTKNRAELQRMITDCENGKIDIILCKSISRMARNTVDLLNIVRHLKDLGVEIRFEKENISSLTADGELMLTILAGFAEEESKSISANIKWAFRKKLERGGIHPSTAFGYDWVNGNFVVNEKEAEAVRLIFSEFLKDTPLRQIARLVNEMGFEKFANTGVRGILQNRVYTGDVITQKYFVENPLTHKLVKNNGELPMYLVENNHEGIISHETFETVQEKIRANLEFNKVAGRITGVSPFTKHIFCHKCGCAFIKGYFSSNKQTFWSCGGKRRNGASWCDSKTITETRLKAACCKVMGTDEFDPIAFGQQVERIDTTDESTLVFTLTDGRIEEVPIIYFTKEKRLDDPHHILLGYRWEHGKGYVIQEEEAELVRTAYRLYAEGATFREIQDALWEAGFKSSRGTKVSQHKLRKAIDNEIYIGRRTVPGKYTESGEDEVIENDHEPIVSTELDAAVKARRAQSRDADLKHKTKEDKSE